MTTIFNKRQRGAALVVAMLILGLVVVFVAGMTVEYNFGVRRVANQIAAQQAYSYLRGTEAMAHKVLMLDLQNDNEDGAAVDDLGELWAQEAPPFVIEEGAYGGRLYDLQGRFNLNSLRATLEVRADEVRPAIPYTVAQGIFIRLLESLGDDTLQVSRDDAVAITEALVDWLDQDREASGFNCGEDDAYYHIEGRQPHRTSNLPMASVSELRLICNLPVWLYERLVPHVTVWPASGHSTININTATVPVLRSIIISDSDADFLRGLNGKTTYQPPPPVSEADLENVVKHQQADGYTQLSQVKVDLNGYQLWPGSQVGLYSNYFLLESTAIVGDVTQAMSSVISRENGAIVVIARSTGGL